MNRNVLTLIVIVLVVVVGVIGYQLYQERHKAGVEVEVGKGGISVQTN